MWSVVGLLLLLLLVGTRDGRTQSARVVPTVLRDSLLLLLPPCFYIAKFGSQDLGFRTSIFGSQDLGFRTSIFGSQNLGFRTSIFGSQDLGFRTSINGHWVSAPRQTHAISEIIYSQDLGFRTSIISGPGFQDLDIWLSGPGFQDLDKRTLGFSTSTDARTFH